MIYLDRIAFKGGKPEEIVEIFSATRTFGCFEIAHLNRQPVYGEKIFEGNRDPYKHAPQRRSELRHTQVMLEPRLRLGM